MARVAEMGHQILKWLPILAVVAAAYKYYADRGFEGIVADLQSITIEGIKQKFQTIVIGFALIIGAPVVAKYIPNSTLKPVAKAVMYYVGATQLFGALRSGAGRGWITAGRQPMRASSVYQGRA